MVVTTNDFSYALTLRPRITIKTLDGVDTLYTYDAFDPDASDIIVSDLDMENAVGEAGTFNMQISDNNNIVPKDNIHNVKVFLELGKTQADYEHFMIGYADIFEIDRPSTAVQSYAINGFGSKLWAYQLMIHRREKYKKTESDAKIYNIIDNALTKRLWRPLKSRDDSIADITGWSRDGISNKVNTVYTVINKAFTYFGDLCDELCDVSGAVWFIDYSTGSEIFTLTYNPDLQVPVIIKSGDLMDRANDPATTTSYIKSAFGVEDNTTTEGGCATRLLTTTIADKELVVDLDESHAHNNLNNKALCQQFIINNDARRIEAIALRLEKKGEPESPNSRVNGDICLDNGSNQPTGTILDTFEIGLGSLREAGDWLEAEVDISPSALDTAQSKLWVRLFQRSGDGTTNSGEPQDDPDNTVLWHHDNVLNTATTLYSGSAPVGDAKNKSGLNWSVTNQGPTYTLQVFSNIRRLFARTNQAAVQRLRLREVFIPTDFLSDPQDVNRYMALNLSLTSKGRRGIADFQVTIPNNFIFRPYQWISFNDGLSDIFDTLQVQRAGYIFGSTAGDPQIGTLSANLTLSGSYNTLLQGCTCL